MNKKRKKNGQRIHREITVVANFADAEKKDKEYWLKQTPQARLRAMERMRQINYGKAATGRLQRVLEIVQSK